MNMPEPSLTPGGDAKDPILNPAVSAPEADAPNTEAAASSSTPATDGEAEAEEIMTEGEEEVLAQEENALTLASVVASAAALLDKPVSEIATDELRRLRQQFNSLYKPATPTEGAEGEEAAEIAPEAQLAAAQASEFVSIMEQLKSRRAAYAAEQEAQRKANLERKNAIIEEILALADDTDNVNRTFARYRDLQEEFNSTGDVDPAEETSVWKRYQDARERYSDNLKINKELRDYDFKKNLTEKEQLLEEARGLVSMEDVIVAYRRLQDLHNQWRLIGPVAKELRESIWNSFREASAEVNKRYQAFFEARKAREAENEIAKTALCTQIEALDYSSLKTFAAWEDITRTIVGLQEEWRKLGFASKKLNRQLFARFRRSCDEFFAAKAEFYRVTRDGLAANLAHKQELADRAEALKDSTDWRTATDQFVEMQKEWKAIGAIPKKYSESLWNRFTAACDYFFDQKKKANSGTRQTETANLRAKREIIGQLSALIDENPDKDTALAQLRDLQKRWQEIGHVPFRDKDKLYEAYRSAVDAVRKHFAIAESRARRARFEANVEKLEGDNDKLFRERERLVRAMEGRRNDLRTYENNLGFLSAKSKNGDSLLRDLERRIERLKADIAEIEDKIRLIDGKLS